MQKSQELPLTVVDIPVTFRGVYTIRILAANDREALFIVPVSLFSNYHLSPPSQVASFDLLVVNADAYQAGYEAPVTHDQRGMMNRPTS